MAIPVAIAAAQAVTGIAATIAGISDMQKRRFYEMNLGLLNYDQRERLEKQMMEADSENARLAILQQTLGSVNTARAQGLSTVQAEKEKTKKTVLTIALIGGFIIIGGLLFIGKRR
jgi:hypothetical protein